MNDDDFLLDEEEDLDSGYDVTQDDDIDDENESEDEENLSEEDEDKEKLNESDYKGKMTQEEIYLSSAYDDIVSAAKKNDARVSVGEGRQFDGYIVDAVRTIIGSSPKNTSTMTIENIVKEFFQTQGHNRIPASVYVPDKPIRVGDLDEELGGLDDGGFNKKFAEEARNQISEFVKYLAERDLSKDSISSRRRKQRQLPAFIIFLFCSDMYDYILNCPDMPKEYDDQIHRALDNIQKRKLAIVEELAQRYDSKKRYKVAERVRQMGVSWFDREPADLRSIKLYADLELTHEDIMDYREFRPRFNNASKNITQELISDFIEVVVEPGKIYEKLKDKTRSEAIIDVKRVYKEWAEQNTLDSDLANKIIWKNT